MWELDCEEGWAPKNWCFWTVVLEKTLESPLDCKEIQPVHSEDQPWGLFGRNDAKADTPVLWPPHAKGWLIGKVSDAGRDSGQDDRGWDGWMASLTQRSWVWVNSRSWWWTGRPGVLQFMGSQRVGTWLRDWTELSWNWSTGEGNGNPLQCSCLENPRDGGAWWAAVYGVAQSRTRLKRLSSSSSKLKHREHLTNLPKITCNRVRILGSPICTTVILKQQNIRHKF